MRVHIGRYPKDDKARTESVKIEPHDLWSLDHTLALVILPALKLYRENYSGIPGSLISGEYEKSLEWGSPAFRKAEKKAHDRGVRVYEKALDEMIWAFDQIVTDCAALGPALPDPLTPASKAKWRRQHDAYHKRIDDGLALFAKYFRSMWT
jgi:hypothetical protein